MPPLSNTPSLFRGRKLISLPLFKAPLPLPYYYSLIDDGLWVLVNHDCKTLSGLILDGLFTSWKFGFAFDPCCMTSNFLYLSFSTLHPTSSSLWRTDTIGWTKLNKPHISTKVPLNVFEINKPLGCLIADLWYKIYTWLEMSSWLQL